MGVRKQFPGGMVKGVSIPGQSFSNFQQASSSFNTLASKLDRMVNFAVSEGEKVAVAQGAEYAAANPISVQQYYDANPEEREKMVGGDKYTSYGKALRAAQINFLATDLAIKAEKDMVKLKTIAVGSNMDVEMYEAGLDGIVKGYTDAMADTDAEAAISVKAKIASSANTYYTSYLDDKIKDYKSQQKLNAIEYGETKIAQISDELKAGVERSLLLDTGEDYEEFDIDKHFAIKKEQYLAELKKKDPGKEYIKGWIARWDAEVIQEKKNYMYSKYVNTDENLSSTIKARAIYKEVQNGNFEGNKELQKIFNSLDDEEKKDFVNQVRDWRNNLIDDKKIEQEDDERDLTQTKSTFMKQYLEYEENNDVAGAKKLIKDAYAIDEKLGNELKVLFNTEKEEGKFFNQETKDDLYFDYLQNKLSQQEVFDAAKEGLISRETALDLTSRLATKNSAIYTKADLELRRLLGVPEPEAINSSILKSKKYREYIRASGELIKYYNKNSMNQSLTGESLLKYAQGLVTTQKTTDIEKEEFKNNALEIIGTSPQGFNLDSSDWENYFRNFYNKNYTSASYDFFDFNDKGKLDLLIKELKELKLMKPGTRYKPGTVPPSQLEVGSGVPLVGTDKFERPNGITDDQLDILITRLEDLK